MNLTNVFKLKGSMYKEFQGDITQVAVRPFVAANDSVPLTFNLLNP